MDIILDSNIYRSDLQLRSKDFDIVLDYLNKTNSSLILPQIILDEIKGLYKRALHERISDMKKSINNLQLALLDDRYKMKVKDIDIDAETRQYETFIRKKFSVKDHFVLPYQNEFLPEISRRAIHREKPSGEKGQGFRDTLIWLTIKEYAQKCTGRQLSFISINADDFGNASKDSLHESLISECEKIGVKIHYFKSLKEFIAKHSNTIEFITSEWIEKKLDFNVVEKMAIEDINKNGQTTLPDWFERKTDKWPTGYFQAHNMKLGSIHPATVYEMQDNTLLVKASLSAEIEVEFEYYLKHYLTGPNGEDQKPRSMYSSAMEMQYVDAELELILTIVKDKIIETELVGWQHY